MHHVTEYAPAKAEENFNNSLYLARKNYLLQTEHGSCGGKYWLQVVAVGTNTAGSVQTRRRANISQYGSRRELGRRIWNSEVTGSGPALTTTL